MVTYAITYATGFRATGSWITSSRITKISRLNPLSRFRAMGPRSGLTHSWVFKPCKNPEWESLCSEWPAVLALSQTKTILSGIISIVSDLRNVFLKCLVSLTTMMSRDILFWAWSGQRIMTQFIRSLSLMTILYFLVEYWGREYGQSGTVVQLC